MIDEVFFSATLLHYFWRRYQGPGQNAQNGDGIHRFIQGLDQEVQRSRTRVQFRSQLTLQTNFQLVIHFG